MDGTNSGQGSHCVLGKESKFDSFGVGCMTIFSECPHCELMAVRGQQCHFCQEHVDDQALHTHMIHTQHISNSSQTCERGATVSRPSHSPDAGANHQGRLDCQAEGRGHQRSNRVESHPDQGRLGRLSGDQERQSSRDHEGRTLRPQASISQEGRPSAVPWGHWGSSAIQGDCGSHVQQGRGSHHPEVRTDRQRDSGLWQVRDNDLRGGGRKPPGLFDMVHQGSERDRFPLLANGAPGEVGLRTGLLQDHEDVRTGQESPQDSRSFLNWISNKDHDFQLGRLAGDEGQGQSQGNDEASRGDPTATGGLRLRRRESHDAEEDPTVGRGECRPSSSAQSQQRPEGDVREECFHTLPDKTAQELLRSWGPHTNQYSKAWQQLVQHHRPLLMELACFENSILSEEVQKRYSTNSSIRLSNWNGADLETEEGVQFAIKMLRQHRPVHLWISCECGPYSILQRLNQKNPQQVQQLHDKQQRVRRQYQGALRVAEEAFRLKTEVHWELSQRCEAWSLPEIVDYVSRHKLEKVSCAGCTVGLRTRDQSKLMCKSWTATKNERLLQHLNLRCQKNHPKGKCEAGESSHTARYTNSFARKVVDSLCMSEVWSKIVQEIHASLEEQANPAEQEDEPQGIRVEVDDREREEIVRRIQHVHRCTGHGDMKGLVKALQKRGAAPHVVELAKQWECPTCAERKRPDPRRFSTFDGIVPKGDIVEADIATWVHPINRNKKQIAVFTDVGSRFAVGKFIERGTWEELQDALNELWIPYFGRPKTLRVDPAGAFLKGEADLYLAEQDIFLDVIPAEAHWRLGIVEHNVKSIKGMLDSLAEEFTEATDKQLLSLGDQLSHNLQGIQSNAICFEQDTR